MSVRPASRSHPGEGVTVAMRPPRRFTMSGPKTHGDRALDSVLSLARAPLPALSPDEERQVDRLARRPAPAPIVEVVDTEPEPAPASEPQGRLSESIALSAVEALRELATRPPQPLPDFHIHLPPVEPTRLAVTVEPPQPQPAPDVHVHIPEQAPPVIELHEREQAAPEVHVHVPPAPLTRAVPVRDPESGQIVAVEHRPVGEVG